MEVQPYVVKGVWLVGFSPGWFAEAKKSDGGNSAVRPRNLREVLGVTQSAKFSDKGSYSEMRG